MNYKCDSSHHYKFAESCPLTPVHILQIVFLSHLFIFNKPIYLLYQLIGVCFSSLILSAQNLPYKLKLRINTRKYDRGTHPRDRSDRPSGLSNRSARLGGWLPSTRRSAIPGQGRNDSYSSVHQSPRPWLQARLRHRARHHRRRRLRRRSQRRKSHLAHRLSPPHSHRRL